MSGVSIIFVCENLCFTLAPVVTIFAPLDEEITGFKRYFSENNRCILSAPFGEGKSYFLNEVLKERSVGKYNIMNDSRFETLCELSQLVYKRR